MALADRAEDFIGGSGATGISLHRVIDGSNLLAQPSLDGNIALPQGARARPDHFACQGIAAQGDILLRSIPAIKAIIEKGDVVLTEPGTKSGVMERIVIAAAVEFQGTIRNLAVSVHRAPDGHYQYDFTFDASAGDGTPRVTRGGLAQISRPLPSLEMPRPTAGMLNLGSGPINSSR